MLIAMKVNEHTQAALILTAIIAAICLIMIIAFDRR